MKLENALVIGIALLLTASSFALYTFEPNEDQQPEQEPMSALQAGPFVGFPDKDPDSGKFLGAAGIDLSTLAGQVNKLYIGIPAGQTSFNLGIFDGEGANNWDQPVGSEDQIDFRLYKDPYKSGGMTLLDSWNGYSMLNDQWANRTYSTSSDAKAPSGNYFYRLEINWNSPTSANDINSFKVRVDGQVSVVRNQPYCIEGAPINPNDPPLGSGDPNPGDQNDPGANSYDGSWLFYFYVPTKVHTMNFQDGDFDRADDSDDANTPNTDPDGAGPAVAEGVNPGLPPDDPLPPTSATIAPSVNYTVTSPAGSNYKNTNPSGNQEWENFIISDNASLNPDYLTSGILPAGLWKVQIVGLDAHNLACLSVPYEVFSVDEAPLPINRPPVVEPDRSVTVFVPPPQTVSFAHNVSNLGAPQIFDLTAVSAHGWSTRIYHDKNGNGVLDTGEPRVNDTGLLGTNSTFKIIVQVDVPSSPSDLVDITTVRASSQLEWAVQDTATDTINVITNRPPNADANGPYTGYENSAITFDGSGSSDPDNDTLQYRWDFDNDGLWDTAWSLSPYSSHAWGDDYTGQVSLQVTDGKLYDSDTTTVTVLNVLPSGSVTITSVDQHEGTVIQFSAHVTDPGSDDIIITWSWGDGSANEQSTYYNDGVGPDPYPSPDVNPRNVTDSKSHTYGDNGAYTVTVVVRDDDSGTQGTTVTVTATPDNLPPSLQVSGGTDIDEGQSVSFTATATDPGSDDLTFEWSWGEGTTESRVYYNDGIGPDPPNSPGGTYPFTATDAATHVYGDNGLFDVTLTVTDDDGASVTYETRVNVLNVPPEIISDISAQAIVDLTLRVAGEKWHDVVLTLHVDGVPTMIASVVREPGSPDEQAVTIRNVTIDLLGESLSAVIEYTPLDDPINGQWWGSDPAWLILTGKDGNESRLHHTFKVRHEKTWTWIVTDFRNHLVGIPIDFNAIATDPGSDDLTFNWDSGDGRICDETFYNDGLGPDPYPSPEYNPIIATSEVSFEYQSPGTYTVTLTVADDDGGMASTSVTITIG